MRSKPMRGAVVGLLMAGAPVATAQDGPQPPPDFVVPSALPKVPPPVTAATKLPAGHLDRLGRLLGLDPCDYAVSRRAGRPVDAVALVEAQGSGCVVWDSVSAPGTNSFLASMNVAGVSIPVVGYAKVQPVPGAPPVLVLDLVGGPAGDISPGLNDSLQEALVQRGAVVVKPAYSGTRHRSGYPAPDFDAAVREVVAIARKLRQANPRSKLIVMGESLGGLIAAKAVSSRSGLCVDGLALVIPLVYSPNRAIRNFRRLAHASRQGFTPLWIKPEPARKPVRPLNGPARGRVGEYRAVSSIDLFEAYFPTGSRDVGLLSYLRDSGGLPTLIAYGANDPRVGIEDLQDPASLPNNVHALKLDGSGHAVDAGAAQRIASMMWSTFSLPRHEGSGD